MKKLILAAVFVAVIGCFFATSNLPVYAVNVTDPVCNSADPNNLPAVCKDSNAATKDPNNAGLNPIVGPNGIITTYIHILALLIAAGAVVVIILSGLRFATSSGDPAAVNAARNGILYAAVGLGVAAVAQAMVTFVIAKV